MLTNQKVPTERAEYLRYAEFLLLKQPSAMRLVTSGADPWVTRRGDTLYYCRVHDDWQIIVNKAEKLEDIAKQNHVVWNHPDGSAVAEVWAPELHWLKGKWYIYFTAGRGPEHRMYVLEAKTDDPQGEYEFKGQITTPDNHWAIDGTVMTHKGVDYFIWSGWETEEDVAQNLYIARMTDPCTLEGERVCIARPEYDWELTTDPGQVSVNEGPEALVRNNKAYIIYSASHSLTDDYCLGQLSLEGDNPLDAKSWKKYPKSVFCKTDKTFGPGHASFVELKDGSNWIIYHTAKVSGGGWDRQIQAQRFIWTNDDQPYFGTPRALRSNQKVI